MLALDYLERLWRGSSPLRLVIDVMGVVAFLWMIGSSLWFWLANRIGVESGLLVDVFYESILPLGAFYTALSIPGIWFVRRWFVARQTGFHRVILGLSAGLLVFIGFVGYQDIRYTSRSILVVDQIDQMADLGCQPGNSQLLQMLESFSSSPRFWFLRGKFVEWRNQQGLVQSLQHSQMAPRDEFERAERTLVWGETRELMPSQSRPQVSTDSLRPECSHLAD